MDSIRDSFEESKMRQAGAVADRATAQKLVDLGMAAESTGNAREALRCFHEASLADPGFALAHMNLGIVLHDTGRIDEAIAAHRRAIALDSASAAGRYNLGLVLLESGDAVTAEVEFSEALRLRAKFPEACVALAEALESLGHEEDALAYLERAIELRAQYPGARFNACLLLLKMGRRNEAEARLREMGLDDLLPQQERHAEIEHFAGQILRVWPEHVPTWRVYGTVLVMRHRFEDAVPALRKYLMLMPSDPEVLSNLGAALLALGRHAEAEVALRDAMHARPDDPNAHTNLGKVLLADGRPRDAENHFLAGLQLDPGNRDALVGLGDAQRLLGRLQEAEQTYRKVLGLSPDTLEVLINLGVVLQKLGRLADAEGIYRRALALAPEAHLAHANLGTTLQALGRLTDSEICYRRAIELKPDVKELHSNLGSLLRETGRLQEAEACFRRALELDPGYGEARSNLLFTLNYTDRLSRAEVFEEHRAWARLHEPPRPTAPQGYTNLRDPDRKLRIAYVSPDFRRHSVAYFIEPLLAGHDRKQFEVVCYSNVTTPDNMTRRLLALADTAHSILELNDDEAAGQVRADGIDILVDLAGHSGQGRLGLFSRKPAPVQVSYLGYPNTTGLDTIGWRLTDPLADPAGDADAFHSEQLARLPKSFLCFRPPEEAPEILAAPRQKNGFVTFGSFNALPKITPAVISLWARVLQRVPGSRLMLKAMGLNDPGARGRIIDAFGREGVSVERLTILPMDIDFTTHLARYQEMDIALDPFPYNGTTTTLEALWMGVPVISLAGNRHCARVGHSILKNLRLDGLVADSVDDYVAIAETLAAQHDRLADLRGSMRVRISGSALRDEVQFSASVEFAYRRMWRLWCRT